MLPLLAILVSMLVPPMTEAQLREQADVVVDATVAAQHISWVGARIFTFSTVVTGSGSGLRSYLVALPGGDIDDLSQRVPGSPRLVLGARYRFYLGKADGPAPAGRTDATVARARGVVGFYRGVFLIDEAHNADLVPFGEDGLPLKRSVQ